MIIGKQCFLNGLKCHYHYRPIRGGSRANLKEGQLVVGALKDFQKLVTRVRCIQQFQIHFWNKQHKSEVILEAN